jgi:hypothetical protein
LLGHSNGFGEVPVDGLQDAHVDRRAFPTQSAQGLQSPRLRGGWTFSEGQPFESWTEAMGLERLTKALLDRLSHRVHILEANGESYRLCDARGRLKQQPSSTARRA